MGYRRGTQIDTEDRVSQLPRPMPPGRLAAEANLAADTIYLKIKKPNVKYPQTNVKKKYNILQATETNGFNPNE